MPASIPGSTLVQNKANPSVGAVVTFDLLSGPKGSPMDARKLTIAVGGNASYVNDAANQNPSTGGLSTGIGYGEASPIINTPGTFATAALAIRARGFDDDEIPGATKPDNTAAADSTFMYIGGGKTAIVAGTGPNGNGWPTQAKVASSVPYVAGFGIGAAGNGGSRDAGAGPAFTGFPMKMVTAAGAVANGAVIEAGWTNRSNVGLVVGQSVFGSQVAASAAPA